MRKFTMPSLVALVMLVACGGGGGGAGGSASGGTVPPPAPLPDPAPAPEGRTGTTVGATAFNFFKPDSDFVVPSEVVPDFDVTRDLIVVKGIRGPGELRTLRQVSDALMPDGFTAYNDGPEARAVRGVTQGGAAYAIRWAFQGTHRGHERFGATELPASGHASFTGTYAGTLGDLSNDVNLGTIRGLVSLEADFGTSRVSGEITGRRNQNDRDFDPVTLLATDLSRTDGSFVGRTEGGRSAFLGHTETEGDYGGLIVGPEGGGAVGSLTIAHTRSPTFTVLRETGAFVAASP